MKVRINVLGSFTRSTFNEYAEFHNEWRSLKNSKLLISLWCKTKDIRLIDCRLPSKSNGKVGGTTNGDYIAIDFTESDALNFFLFWHEYAHFKLHFTKTAKRLSLTTKEQEADVFAAYMCNQIFPGHYDAFVKFAKDNPTIDAPIQFTEPLLS
jgi:hypothetical protein